MKKIILPIILLILIGGLVYIYTLFKPVSKKGEGKEVLIEIKEGESTKSALKKLKKENIIKSEHIVKFKLGKRFFLPGKYKLSSSDTIDEIIDKLVTGKKEKDRIKVQFIEGKTLKTLASVVEKNTNLKKEEFLKEIDSKEFVEKMAKKYPFIDKDVVLSKDIYHPLEGYLFPDTYFFESKDVTAEEIVNAMLKETSKRLSGLDEIKERKLKLTNHQILTLASIVELEAGTNSSKDEKQELSDREKVAQVFANRLKKKISLGSDVTTYYAFGIELSQRDLTKKELNTKNPYNTRGPEMEGKLPIGPIAAPSTTSIKAVIDLVKNYKETDELFFVSDKTGKIYLTKTNGEHERLIEKLKREGLWFEY